MKFLWIFVGMVLLLMCGCPQKGEVAREYVCPDGSVVNNPNLCTQEEQGEENGADSSEEVAEAPPVENATNPNIEMDEEEEITECFDGTPIGECSEEKPLFCTFDENVGGVGAYALRENATFCGCPEGYEEYGDYCIEMCTDGEVRTSEGWPKCVVPDCLSDEDCDYDKECGEWYSQITCVERGECTKDTDCSAGEICWSGECSRITDCSSGSCEDRYFEIKNVYVEVEEDDEKDVWVNAEITAKTQLKGRWRICWKDNESRYDSCLGGGPEYLDSESVLHFHEEVQVPDGREILYFLIKQNDDIKLLYFFAAD